MLRLLQQLAIAYQSLSRFDCQRAIEQFRQLPLAQFETGWVQANLARAYFESVQYVHAQSVFRHLRRIDPYRNDSLEIYSTLLWHLRSRVELSFLAHELVELDRRSPQAWCAVGNCFSLQSEHEQALKCFQRAIDLEPSYAYAHTLAGHELIASEQLDKAQVCFRNALRVNRRHYNAWFGRVLWTRSKAANSVLV